MELTKEKEKMKNDYEYIERKLNELNLENKVQNEELLKIRREKTAIDSQKKESEKLRVQEEGKVDNLEKELLKLKYELKSKNDLVDEYKLSMPYYFENYVFHISNLTEI